MMAAMDDGLDYRLEFRMKELDAHGNVKRLEGYRQVVMWQGVVVGKNIEEFESFMLKEFGVTVQYLEEVLTTPDLDKNGMAVGGTGGRNDLLFAVKDGFDVAFCLVRLKVGMRWIEDVVENAKTNGSLWPARIARYRTWDGDWNGTGEVKVEPVQPKKPIVELTGRNGNAFAVMGACKEAARKAGWARDKIDALIGRMTAGTYDQLLQVAIEEFEVE